MGLNSGLVNRCENGFILYPDLCCSPLSEMGGGFFTWRLKWTLLGNEEIPHTQQRMA